MTIRMVGIKGDSNIESLAKALQEWIDLNSSIVVKSEDIKVVYNEIERRYVALITYQR